MKARYYQNRCIKNNLKLKGPNPCRLEEFEIIKFVLMTEKSVQKIEAENRLVFIVSKKSNKNEVMKSVESIFNSKVKGVRTMIDQEGRKKAFVEFEQEGAAGEIAIKLGII